MKSIAVKRMRSELQETPRPECTAASQVAGSRDRNTVFTIGGILRHTLRASVTVLQESGEQQQDQSLIPGAMLLPPAAALRRLEPQVSGGPRPEALQCWQSRQESLRAGLCLLRRLRAFRLRLRLHAAGADPASVPLPCLTRRPCSTEDPLLCVSIVGAARTSGSSERAARRLRARLRAGLQRRSPYGSGSRDA